MSSFRVKLRYDEVEFLRSDAKVDEHMTKIPKDHPVHITTRC